MDRLKLFKLEKSVLSAGKLLSTNAVILPKCHVFNVNVMVLCFSKIFFVFNQHKSKLIV